MTQYNHSERIAHEHQIYPRFIDEARSGIVIRGKRGDGLALPLHFGQCRHCDFCDRGTGGRRSADGEVGKTHVVSSAAPQTQDATRTRASIRLLAAPITSELSFAADRDSAPPG